MARHNYLLVEFYTSLLGNYGKCLYWFPCNGLYCAHLKCFIEEIVARFLGFLTRNKCGFFIGGGDK